MFCLRRHIQILILVHQLSLGKLTVFNRFLEIFAQKYGSFSPKIAEKKMLSKSVSGYYKTKKKALLYTKPRGRGVPKGLSGLSTKKKNRGFPYLRTLVAGPAAHDGQLLPHILLNVVVEQTVQLSWNYFFLQCKSAQTKSIFQFFFAKYSKITELF